MMRQGGRQALKIIKERVRINAFGYSQYAFETMVDQWLYEEDVKHGIETGRLVEVRTDEAKGTHYLVQGFAMNEEEFIMVCRILRRKIEVVDLYWA